MLKLFRPHVLHWYVVSEYLKNFALSLAACTLLWLLCVFVVRAAELEEYGVSFEQMALLAPFFFPYALAYALPLAAMIAAILVFGRLAAENEILAAQSGGASIALLSAPLLFCGFVFSVFALWCNDAGVSWGFTYIREQVLTLNNPQIQKQLEKPGKRLAWRLEGGGNVQINMLPHETGADGRELRPIHIAYFNRGKILQSLHARHFAAEWLDPERSAGKVMRRLRITLFEGQSLGDDPKFFKDIDLTMTLPDPTESQFSLGRSRGTVGWMGNWNEARKIRESILQRRQFVLERAALFGAQVLAGSPADPAAPLVTAPAWVQAKLGSDVAAATGDKVRRELVEFHRKLALSMMPLSMVFLGIGLGLLVRKGNRLVGFILGVLTFFVVYYPLMVISKELACIGLVDPLALWTPNLFLLGLGLWLWWAFEHGHLSGALPAWTQIQRLQALSAWLRDHALSGLGPREAHRLVWLLPFRRKADRHVASTFLAPLLTVAIASASLYIVLDLVEHGNEVVVGVLEAQNPQPGLPKRALPQAVLDVVFYYSIRAMDMMFDLLPVLLLIAGVLAVTIMVRNNEHLIFKSSGTRLQRAFLPMLLAAACCSVFVTFLRETVMPTLILERDRLKPLIYHRDAKPQSVSGQAADERHQQVLYEIAEYRRGTHTCDELRIYLTAEAAGSHGRFARVVADRAVWEAGENRWLLQMAAGDPNAVKSGAAQPVRYVDAGLLLQPEPTAGAGTADARFHFNATKLPYWDSSLSPSFLESQTLGPSVMALSELWAVRDRAEYRSEIWHRLFGWPTGILLLMLTVPLLVRQEVRSPLVGVAFCILIGALYMTVDMAFTELGRQGFLPSWSPVLPHLFFLGLALRQYVYRMET